MMRSQIDAARERGEPVAVLWATEDTIYGQFGYGMASVAAEIDLPREHAAAFARDRRAGAGAARGRSPRPSRWSRRSTRASRAKRRACIARTSAWWQDRLLIDHPWRRRAAARCAAPSGKSTARATAYAFYRVNQAFERGISSRPCLRGRGDGRIAAGDPCDLALPVRHRLGSPRVKAIFLPVDHPLLLSLAAPRRLNFLVREGLWVRLIDVGAALSARGYATDDTVVIDVTDEFCPWNAGRWRVGRGGVEKTGADADLACDVALARLRLSRRIHLCATRPLAAGHRIARWRDRARRCNVPFRPRAVVPGVVLRIRSQMIRYAARSPLHRPEQPVLRRGLLERGIGIRFAGKEKTNVEEYCVSEGWIRVAAGKALDRKGNPLTIKLKGPVEPYFKDQPA